MSLLFSSKVHGLAVAALHTVSHSARVAAPSQLHSMKKESSEESSFHTDEKKLR